LSIDNYYQQDNRLLIFDENLYSIASKQAGGCYLQQHEEGWQQQHDDCKETVVNNFTFFCQVVVCFIIVFLKETINVAQI